MFEKNISWQKWKILASFLKALNKRPVLDQKTAHPKFQNLNKRPERLIGHLR